MKCKLFLAPMEGVGAAPFRRAMARIGGFDEACTEFIRVGETPHIPSLIKLYDPKDTAPIPQAAQVMGSHPEKMAAVARALEAAGAPRIDLNCGCPSNKVTGRGAGSSLLKEPKHLYAVAKAMVEAVSVPVSVKLRSGFADTALFDDNMCAAAESGASFLTLHPRTKLEGYKPPAHWHLIARAKELVSIPVIGNGDITSVEDAHRMLKETRCDGLMIGRGAVTNPWIFHEIKASFSEEARRKTLCDTLDYVRFFASQLDGNNPIGQLKQLMGFLFRANERLEERRQEMLRGSYSSKDDFLAKTLPIFSAAW